MDFPLFRSARRIPCGTGRGRMAACLMVLAGGPWLFPARAVTATSLASFEGIEEPLVRYAPGTNAFVHDKFVNIIDQGGGVFRMRLRYRSDEWDADRDTPNKDRQRAEVKGLGIHQKTGETFEYSTTWRTSAGFIAASRFCHLFQLKSTDGDSGAPVVTLSIQPEQTRVSVRYWSDHEKRPTVVREFAWKPDTWQTVRLRIKTSTTAGGEVLVSVDGDAYRGARDVAVFRPDATDYRPKWGLYRGVKTGLRLGDDYVEHKAVSAEKIGAVSVSNVDVLRTLEHKLAQDSPEKTLAWLQSQPRSPVRAEAFATVVATWAEHDPAAAMTFAEKLAPEDGRAEALRRVFNRWTDRDADAVLRWAATRAPTAELDSLLWYFATDTTLRYGAREKALAGAQLISDPDLRGRAIEHIVLIWARSESAAATHYVQESAVLSPTQRNEIAEKIKVTRK